MKQIYLEKRGNIVTDKTFKDWCEEVVDASIFVKHEEGLQKINVMDNLSDWLRRLRREVETATIFEDTTITMFVDIDREQVITTFSQWTNAEEQGGIIQQETIRDFKEVGDLIAEMDIEVPITVN